MIGSKTKKTLYLHVYGNGEEEDL